MELEFDVKVNSKVLYDYMLHHTYSSFQGVIGTLVGALMLVGFAVTRYVIWLIAGIVLLAYVPWSLFLKSKQQMLNTPAFKNPFDCGNKFAEAGDEFFKGDLGYHMRKGTHYFSREDWQKLIKFVLLK